MVNVPYCQTHGHKTALLKVVIARLSHTANQIVRETNVRKLPSAFVFLALLLVSACHPTPSQPGSYNPGLTQVSTLSTEKTRPDHTPTAKTSATGSPAVEETPLSVGEVTSYFDRNGTLYVTGLVRSYSDQALAGIQVSIQVQDSQGGTIDQATVPLTTNPLTPGERAVFIQDFAQITSATPVITAHIVAFTQASSEKVELNINTNSVLAAGEARLYLTGEVLNTLPVPVYIETISAAFFDQDGNFKTASTWELGSHYLEPGETGPFRITIDLTNLQIQTTDPYEVYYRAERGPLIQPAGLFFQGEPEYFSDSQGNFHLLAYVRNDSDVALGPVLLATLYDPDGKLVDISSSNLFGLPLSPGETLPVEFSSWGILNAIRPGLDHNWEYALQWDPVLTQPIESNWTILEVQLESQTNEAGIISVQGMLSNPGNRSVRGYTILARFWDPFDGNTIALITQRDDGNLPAGQSIPFTLEVKLPEESGHLDPGIELIAKGEPID